MIEIVKTVYIVMGGNNAIEKITMQDALAVKEMLESFTDLKDKFYIETKQKTFYEIEVGDYVKWVDTGRIDKVTKVTENIWGDKVYRTKELNGDKIGEAYESSIELVI